MDTGHIFSNSSTGSQYNSSSGNQNINSGSGSQYNAHAITFLQETPANLLADLRVTDPRDDKTRIERFNGGLLSGSYDWILEHDDFKEWLTDEQEQSRLLWIKGDPGKGKTMLLCGIIDELEKQLADTRNLTYFFCQATQPKLNNATAVIRGLLYILLDQQPSLIEGLRKKYDHAGKGLFEDVNSWDALSKMLINILEEPGLQRKYLVIDALDECEINPGQLLQLIVRVSSSTCTKMIVSSRNWPSIEKALRATESLTRLSLELNAKHVSRAVDTYISHCVSELALQEEECSQDEVKQKLRQKANETFLWVALVIKELRDAWSWEIRGIIDDVPAGLDELYWRMMKRIQQLGRKRPELCRKVLSTMTTAYRPLHLDELQALADLPPYISDVRQLKEITAECGSFLTIRDGLVYLIHQSAKDFLTKNNYLFPSGLVMGHKTLALRSIDVMSKTLGRDLYKLCKSGFPTSQVRPPDPDPLAPSRYSCVFWVEHLAEDLVGQQQHSRGLRDGGPVHEFLEKHYLHWLEALSLLGEVSAGILQMSKLVHLAQTSTKTTKLKDLAWDGLRFIRTHRLGIESSPLQVYASALIFSPTSSVVRDKFRDEEPKWVLTKPIVEHEWNACLQTLESHSGLVRSVAFSSLNTQVASGAQDKTVKVWDVISGQCLRTLRGHSGFVNSVAYVGDTAQLVSASDDWTLKLWDTNSGQCVRTLEGHRNSVNCVALSGDGAQLASASDDHTVKLWSVSGQCLRTLKGHSGPVSSVALSSDGRRLASASSDKTVKLWDTASGQCLHILKGHQYYINPVCFSGDSTLLASVLEGTIKIWDVISGHCLQTLRGHCETICSVAFSGDGTRLASTSDDRTARVWDVNSGQCLRTLKGHSGSVKCIAFSVDGTQLVSASDKTVKFWDGTTNQSLQTLKGHKDIVRSIAFSPDGMQVASAADASTVKVWECTTGELLQTLEGCVDLVSSISFSSDSKMLALASGDQTIKVWDMTTGKCMWTLEGHSFIVRSAVFSSDNTQLASASEDKTIKIWDITSGQCFQTLEGHTNTVTSVAFSSSSSTRLVSGSEDRTIRVWDGSRGQCLQTLEGHSHTVNTVAFSGDGTQLVSASDDYTVKFWDVVSGQCLRTLVVGHILRAVSLSKAGRQLYTDMGAIDLRTFDISSTASPQAVASGGPCFSGYAIGGNGTWITRNSVNLLWLPPEYRPEVSAVVGSTVAIGCASGRVLVLRFSETEPGV